MDGGAVVVLGMHRSGTSLVASMLQAMGVNIGERLVKPAESNTAGHFEDIEFVKLNERLLRACGGHWADPPRREALLLAGQVLRPEIARLVASKQGDQVGLWGWKDPRTSLTAELYHPHLHNPCYIWVRRDRDAVIRSLLDRDGGTPSAWGVLYDLYEQRIDEFLSWVQCPALEVHYEDLVNERTSAGEAGKIAAWLGVGDPEEAARAALELVDHREELWGFGRLGIGVPYWKGCWQFFQWWSWLLVDGFETGDVLLNDWGIRGGKPLPMLHNALARAFLETDCDTFLLIEDDHEHDQDVVRAMRYNTENWPFDIVCASYVNRRGTPVPMGWYLNGEVETGYKCRFALDKVQLAGTQEYDGAALGLVFIRRWVLEAMLGDGDPERALWFQWNGHSSPDIAFYARARELGARVGVDRSAWIGHVGDKVWTKADFVQWREGMTVPRAELERLLPAEEYKRLAEYDWKAHCG